MTTHQPKSHLRRTILISDIQVGSLCLSTNKVFQQFPRARRQTPSHHKLWENTEGARERHRQRERVSPVWDRIKIPLVRLPGSNNAPFCWRDSFSADRVMVTGMLQAFRVDSVFKDFYAEDLRTSTGDPFLRRQRGGVLRDLKCWLGIVVCWAVTNALFPYDFWYV